MRHFETYGKYMSVSLGDATYLLYIPYKHYKLVNLIPLILLYITTYITTLAFARTTSQVLLGLLNLS